MKKLILSICVALSCVSLSMAKMSFWSVKTANGNILKVIVSDRAGSAKPPTLNFGGDQYWKVRQLDSAFSRIRELFPESFKENKTEPHYIYKALNPLVPGIADAKTPKFGDVLRIYSYVFSGNDKAKAALGKHLTSIGFVVPIVQRAIRVQFRNKPEYGIDYILDNALSGWKNFKNVKGSFSKKGKKDKEMSGLYVDKIENYCTNLSSDIDLLQTNISNNNTVANFIKRLSEKDYKKLGLLKIIYKLPEYELVSGLLQALAYNKNAVLLCGSEARANAIKALLKAWGFKDGTKKDFVKNKELQEYEIIVPGRNKF